MSSLIFKLYKLLYWPDRERWILISDGQRVKHFANKAKAVASLGNVVKRPGVVMICRKDGTRQGFRYYDRKYSERIQS